MNVQRGRVSAVVAASLLGAWVAQAAPAQQKEAQQTSANASAAAPQQPADSNAKAGDTAAKGPASPKTPAEARQAELLADTQRLYQLTQELKEEVAKSNKDTLSISVIKKADEVEKLARSLKERMRTPQ